MDQLFPAFEWSRRFHLKRFLRLLEPEHKAPTWPKRRKLHVEKTQRLFPGNSSLQQLRLQSLKFRNGCLFAFLFLLSIISLCSFSALRAPPPPLDFLLLALIQGLLREEYKLCSRSLSHLYSLPISLILERTFVHKAQKKEHPPYPESLPSRLCDTSDILTQNRFYLAPHQEVRVFTSLGRVRISNCHGMSVCPSVRPERRRGLVV